MDPMLMETFGVAAAVEAAVETQLLTAVLRHSGTAEDFAARLQLDPRATANVLDVLVALDFAVREGDCYRAAAALKTFADQIPGGFEQHLALWAHTAHFLRTGEPFARMDAAPSERERSYQAVVPRLGDMFSAAARELASRLRRAPGRVLDVGCGSGVWSLAIAERFASAQVTGLDLPAVLSAFAARAASLGLGSRILTLPGDMHAVELPRRSFDLAIIANVLRLEPGDRARRLIHRVAGALEPDGQMLVIDALSQGTPARERSRSVYALHLALRTDAGQVHPAARIKSWLAEAGLTEVKELDLGPQVGALGALLARARP